MTEPPSPLRRHADKVWEYQPQAVLQRADGSLGVYTGEALRQAMSGEERMPIVFYDVFRSADGKAIYALQAGEYKDNFGLLSFRHQGQELKARLTSRLPFKWKQPEQQVPYLLLSRIYVSARANEAVQLQVMDANGNSVELSVPPYPFRRWNRVGITHFTMQKDYPFVWIRDHCLYMCRKHSVRRYVLYDNGSSNYTELLDEMATWKDKLQVLLINWPFPMFRAEVLPRLGDIHDTVVQRNALNHCFHLLLPRTRYAINLDLDEYLCNRTRLPTKYLIALQTLFAPSKPIASVRVPNIPLEGREYPVRAAAFRYIPRQEKRKWPEKYFCRMGQTLTGLKLEYLDIHNVALKGGKAYNFLKRLQQMKAFGWLAPFLDRRMSSSDAASYWHYMGIQTGWDHHLRSKAGWRTQVLEISPEKFTYSDEMARSLSSVGLGDEQ